MLEEKYGTTDALFPTVSDLGDRIDRRLLVTARYATKTDKVSQQCMFPFISEHPTWLYFELLGTATGSGNTP